MSTTYLFGDCELDEARFELRRAGHAVDAQPKVLKLLFYLVERHERAVSREELLAALWPNETVTAASVKRAIRGARLALGHGADSARGVRTVRGLGYQFVLPVQVAVRTAAASTALPALLAEALMHSEELAQLRPRRVRSGELVRLAAANGDNELWLRGCLSQVQESLEIGDVQGVDAVLTAMQAHDGPARTLSEPFFQWYLQIFRAMRATVAGRFADAEVAARAALKHGHCAGEAGYQAYCVQMVWLHVQRGDARAAAELVREVSARHPKLRAWRSALAYIEALQGDTAAGRRELDQLMQREAVAPGEAPFALSVFAPATELCLFMADQTSARILYQALLPLADVHGVVGAGMATHGPLTRHLGMLATCLSDYDAAQTHFEHALETTTRMPAPAIGCMVRYEYARMLVQRHAPSDLPRARVLLADAVSVAHMLGMQRLLLQCQALRF